MTKFMIENAYGLAVYALGTSAFNICAGYCFFRWRKDMFAGWWMFLILQNVSIFLWGPS